MVLSCSNAAFLVQKTTVFCGSEAENDEFLSALFRSEVDEFSEANFVNFGGEKKMLNYKITFVRKLDNELNEYQKYLEQLDRELEDPDY